MCQNRRAHLYPRQQPRGGFVLRNRGREQASLTGDLRCRSTFDDRRQRAADSAAAVIRVREDESRQVRRVLSPDLGEANDIVPKLHGPRVGLEDEPGSRPTPSDQILTQRWPRAQRRVACCR
jgi:hypothetical protein